MISSDTRLALIDRATDLLGDPGLSPATLTAFVRNLRRRDLDVCDWHRCDDFATAAGLTHHQARTALGQLVRTGLMERDVVPHRIGRQDARYTVYRLSHTTPEGVTQ
ncbi:hypothetical protein [Streptomyces tirandamycinicus]|uniref:MarR family transcriptional regulator n=1 Tax=Streptomyces tirandamycinicus TaxID=2174846 RepID=A0A2S1T228_9ACTN|nr:hypothetical protein [Streptomyces tirandamycinicus]AWI32671.1 hypothetical protein DDW44_30615 [Streptomyces tirandamycinicus]